MLDAVRRRRVIAAFLLSLCLCAAAPAEAYNGSIVFPLQQGDALYPQEQATYGAAERLDELLLAVRGAGHPVKVAMFTAASDFGSASELFGHPQQAARVLDELLYRGREADRAPLLVVMPAGLAATGVSGADRAAIRTVPVDIHARAEEVVAAAGLAVQAFARRQGVDVAASFTAAQASSEDAVPVVGVVLIGLATAIAVATGLLSRRPRAPATRSA